MYATSDIKTNHPTTVINRHRNFINCRSPNSQCSAPGHADCSQTLLRRKHYRSPALVYTLLCTASNAIVALFEEYG